MNDEFDGWVDGALDTLAADDVHVSVPTRVQSAVLDEWDRQRVLPLRRRRTHDWKVRLAWVLVPVATAAMLAIAALPRGAARSPAFEVPRVEEVVPDGAPTTNRLPAVSVDESVTRIPATASIAMPRRPTAVDAGYVIVPAPLVDPAALHIVRARMSRMALATLGVPIVSPDADGLVEVEMLVGDDGVAQSIRHAALVSD